MQAIDEFFDTGRYLVFGCLFASIIQVYVPTRILTSISATPLFAILLLMLLAFLLSLCSEADAFIGASLLSSFGLDTSSGLSRHWSNAGYQKYSHDEKLLESTIYQSLHNDCDSCRLSVFSLDWSHPMIRFFSFSWLF